MFGLVIFDPKVSFKRFRPKGMDTKVQTHGFGPGCSDQKDSDPIILTQQSQTQQILTIQA